MIPLSRPSALSNHHRPAEASKLCVDDRGAAQSQKGRMVASFVPFQLLRASTFARGPTSGLVADGEEIGSAKDIVAYVIGQTPPRLSVDLARSEEHTSELQSRFGI